MPCPFFFFNSSGVRHIVEILQIFIELNLLLSFELKKNPDLVNRIFVFFPLKAGGKQIWGGMGEMKIRCEETGE